MIFVILPHQLFNIKYLPHKYTYYIWEHPYYFTRMKFNKKKLLLHRASMKYYYHLLKSKKYKVKYINFYTKFKPTKFHMFDPIDKLNLKGVIIESPNFFLTRQDMADYRNKTAKFFFYYFYMWSKKKLDIIPNIKSKDKQNRKKLPKKIKIPKLASNNIDDDYIKPAIKYINKHFPNNYGTTNDFQFPVTHSTARKWIKHFIKYKFKNFGSYQDYIHKDESYLFHSCLSTSINIGLINPSDVWKMIQKVKGIPINSYEGFIRQLFWREYQRYCYTYSTFNNNFFGNRKKLSKKWYNGTLGIKPVDDCIKKAFKTGYLHHIERLMIMGNFMNLHGLRPQEGFKWFMEFSCDSYDWVMHQNVYDMVFFNGKTMRRPYISSSNYILKMSNYKKDKWSDVWDVMYHKFIKKHKKKLYKYRYYFRGV
jgi:deoxyribodipyrimidine photolyase-related protein